MKWKSLYTSAARGHYSDVGTPEYRALAHEVDLQELAETKTLHRTDRQELR